MIFQKIKDYFIPEPIMIDVKHYVIFFKTVDGQKHEYHGMNYIDTSSINCSAIEFYLSGKDYLKEDDGTLFPINNIVWIYAKVDDIQTVKQHDGWGIWYDITKED